MNERKWTDEGAAGWTWHICSVLEPARAKRELTGIMPAVGLYGEPRRVADEVATIFDPTEIITVPVKKHGVLVRRGYGKGAPKLQRIERPLFRGYWFVSPASNVPWTAIERTPGITRVMTYNGQPEKAWEAREQDMEQLFARQRDPNRKAPKILQKLPVFEKGQEAKVVDGPFRDFSAVIEAVDKAGRIDVLISIFGRAVAATMDAAQLKAA
ncbi:NusG Transcription antiterminator [uncultured Caudovirales phage]|uniref:NusG Transcription antiterminator n=1 Tax=uncultured Caudovirales phage TaxID=2100421 RepID=A0A6J5PZH6_9CAUD|nr:NusG Transcription antiterminator [uncultured Caudovirales phage]CAB4176532.1 NusG Transcription antiterminator [uncultured Caudovirales phage]CAB4190408.1 NusG Transcription antiterminator [uncultured Caudovirales phage]